LNLERCRERAVLVLFVATLLALISVATSAFCPSTSATTFNSLWKGIGIVGGFALYSII